MSRPAISIVLPTYRREEVLINTISFLLDLTQHSDEIIVVDQSERHETETENRLSELDRGYKIRWIRLNTPSIPHAMNVGLLASSQALVLFLDDDIIPEAKLILAHVDAHRTTCAAIVAGRVVQPWQEGKDDASRFASMQSKWIDEFMGGNFSLQRDIALAVGGFDENFVGAAYRFECEFASRISRAGYRIYFEPKACIHHLRVKSGGTRSYGDYLTSFRPDHPVGAYYYFLRTWTGRESLVRFLRRPFRGVMSRHHLRHPWWIPATLIAEFRAMIWALVLNSRGPKLLAVDSSRKGDVDQGRKAHSLQ